MSEYFRHVDGGYYRREGVAKSSEDLSAWVVYEHVWPFERGMWIRPQAEWFSRFTPVSEAEVVVALGGVREQAQAAVARAKAARRLQG